MLAPLKKPDPTSADATIYVQTNLVSDIPGVAEATDPHLVNPWGVSFAPAAPATPAAPSGSRTRAPIRPLSTR